MADDNENQEERSLEPSERRIQKAREEGQLPQSKDLSTFAVLLALPIFVFLLGPIFMSQMISLVKDGLTFTTPDRWMDHLNQWAFGSFLGLCGILAMIMVPLWIISALSPLSLVSFKPIFAFKFNPSRLDPIAGLGRMFSVNTLAELIKNIFKASLLLGVGLLYLVGLLGSLSLLVNQDLSVALSQSYSLVMYGFMFLLIPMAFIAFGDTFFQWFNFQKRMRMTQEEMRQEIKESEGSPELRAKIRQKQRQIATSRMMQAIEKADVILANPDHYSVALRYDQDKMAAPIVVAKGMDDIALRIQELAKEHQVPIARIPPLARLMHARLDIGQPVPIQLFEAVAKVLAWAYEIKEGIDPNKDLPEIGELPDLDGDKLKARKN
ncbi:flagellar biosynthesis protein FlhB [Polynucleobacter sp. 30F-ANTBAC]|uniref:EscU/YscU/HrcU family type III secretion system export apparatus switch protein n=1 Tax=Polynucleobacter sp. 30F-ANTBAC TaxID=2689095 RepID=UPI001C0AA32C|nr:flagellar type III secretion system protein FlhB [Polynucleobacter sp. 30F-ANTBAC]MBU3599746.1 flagellar biosynthesis protein FlhB [Polynucleobacter sp. 30F-ANTBAC]